MLIYQLVHGGWDDGRCILLLDETQAVVAFLEEVWCPYRPFFVL